MHVIDSLLIVISLFTCNGWA